MDPLSIADYREIVEVSDPTLPQDGGVAFVQRSVQSDAAYATRIVGRRPDEGTLSPWTPESASEPRWSPFAERRAFIGSLAACQA